MEGTDVRFKGASWLPLAKETELLVIGAGGIGSNFIYLASRIGYNITVMDFDTIELHNIGSQFFTVDDVGKQKVAALKQHILKFSGKELRVLNTRYTAQSYSNPIVIVAVDNMDTRKLAFNKWKEVEDRELLIEGRLEGEYLKVLTVKKGQEEWYSRNLPNEEDIQAVACTMASTPHVAMGIASEMIMSLNTYIANKALGIPAYKYPSIFERNVQLQKVKSFHL